MAGSEAIGVQELLVQVVQLTDNLTAATERVKALEAAVAAGGGTSQGSPYIKGGIFDRTLSLPDKLTRAVEFKDWSDDYYEYIVH